MLNDASWDVSWEQFCLSFWWNLANLQPVLQCIQYDFDDRCLEGLSYSTKG
jgi:hypothetical protein